MQTNEQRIEFNSGRLRLEGMLHRSDEPTFGALVLHPHPLYSGDMDNHVVISMCDAMRDSGATTLRFNFPGAGGSEGLFNDGPAERDAAITAMKLLRETLPGLPLVLAGYSFGAGVAAASAATSAPDAIILVSPPLRFASFAPPPVGIPALALTGSDDQVSPPGDLAQLAGYETSIVDGADHSWWGRTTDLNERVRRFLSAIGPSLAR